MTDVPASKQFHDQKKRNNTTSPKKQDSIIDFNTNIYLLLQQQSIDYDTQKLQKYNKLRKSFTEGIKNVDQIEERDSSSSSSSNGAKSKKRDSLPPMTDHVRHNGESNLDMIRHEIEKYIEEVLLA